VWIQDKDASVFAVNLFTEIEEALAVNPHGWCSPEKAQILASIVLAIRPATSVEIGVFGGRSAIPIALAHKYLGFGNMVAIDPWSKEASIEGYQGQDKEWWEKIDHDKIYEVFMRQVTERALENVTTVLRAKSDDVQPPTQIGLLHIDGQHTEQAVRDVQRFAVNVVRGGFVVTDDITWPGGGVQRAVSFLKSIGFVHLYELGTGAVFQRL
jgi:predicted O-methyltransferase YrrM